MWNKIPKVTLMSTKSEDMGIDSEVLIVVVQPLSSVQLFVTLWDVAHQASLSMGFPRQEHWSGSGLPSRGSSHPRDGTCISCFASRHFTTELPGIPENPG